MIYQPFEHIPPRGKPYDLPQIKRGTLTEFGKAIRKARIESGDTLKTMATSLGISPAFLSAVETGKKKIPNHLVVRIEALLKKQGVEVADLMKLADLSNNQVSLNGMCEQRKRLILHLAYLPCNEQVLGEIERFIDTINNQEKSMQKLTLDYIKSLIVNTEYRRFGDTLTVCVLTLRNGFIVTGKSACIHTENFDESIGKIVAYDDAVDKIWELEGYLAVQRNYEAKQ